ncbi:hypothetical protein JCM33374_g6018 [Metschnikowia sp. JCM 33374]|nr:hypothetical protein JCM33374_g6018 [Metschnikowia sp. JCM 33374]
MIQKEPFFDDQISTKPRFSITAEAFKISPSTDYPLMVSAQPPSAPKSVRRPSREPYYHSNSRSSRSASSTSSSYAKFSDIFDYCYLDQLRLEENGLASGKENENALVFESDSEYEDAQDPLGGSEDSRVAFSHSGGKAPSGTKNTEFTVTKECGHSQETALDSDEESDLEDYSVHMLTFKVNSRAQFTRPPRSSRSSVSDFFDGPAPTSRADLDIPKTVHHPKFAAPRCRNSFVDSVLPSPQVDLETYLNRCSSILMGKEGDRKIPAARPNNCTYANDGYESHSTKNVVRDDFEVSLPAAMI